MNGTFEETIGALKPAGLQVLSEHKKAVCQVL